MPGQAEIDFSERGVQLALLMKAQIPDVAGERGKGTGVRGWILKAVLRTIDDHGRGRAAWPAMKTIASEVQVSFGQVRRAIAGLKYLGLLCVNRKAVRSSDPSRLTCNHYVIVWSELALLASDQVRVALGSSARGAHIKCASDAHINVLKRNETPPPTPNRDADTEWRQVEEDFKADVKDIRNPARIARDAGECPSGFRQRVVAALATADLPQNAARIKSRARAVWWFLVKGEWPAEGIVGIEEHRQREEERSERANAIQKQYQIHAAEIEEERRDRQRLESLLGAALDAMPLWEVLELVPSGKPQWRGIIEKRGRDCFRHELLSQLEQHHVHVKEYS